MHPIHSVSASIRVFGVVGSNGAICGSIISKMAADGHLGMMALSCVTLASGGLSCRRRVTVSKSNCLRSHTRPTCVLGNGVMEYYEFLDLMSRVPWGEQGSEQELSSAVHAVFDHEHDGLASVAEMRRILTSVGEPLTDEELDMMLKQLSPDGDGKVTCDGSWPGHTDV